MGPTSERPQVPPGWCLCSYTPPGFCVSSSSSHRCLFWGVSEADTWPGIDPRARQGFELQNPGHRLTQFMERWPACGEILRGPLITKIPTSVSAYPKPAVPLSISTWFSFIFTRICEKSEDGCCSHFTDMNAEAQRYAVTCPRSHSR